MNSTSNPSEDRIQLQVSRRDVYSHSPETFNFLQSELGIGGTGSETSSIGDVLKTSKCIGDVFDMDEDDIFQFP
ncbi:hypothetical protein CK203_081919 [Vitis vinifera]|uniref:Uncharacterized protein n=1 Tax=Vitis vinifera TaxID=29760 RepID=A0A438DX31_VITVI|nr:hypothetical protein CK203_081919 [Vitis vinifera]